MRRAAKAFIIGLATIAVIVASLLLYLMLSPRIYHADCYSGGGSKHNGSRWTF